MLVLSRKSADTIHIGDEIRIVIVQTGAKRVTVAIDAPEDVPIERGEVRERREAFLGTAADSK